LKPRVTVIDYGLGNLFSIQKAFEHCGAEVELAKSTQSIIEADRLVLPGVGAFAEGMKGLKNLGLIEPIKEFVSLGKPFLGICLGMQMLMSESEEFGRHQGLNIFPGTVSPVPRTSSDGRIHKIPHIGWSELIKPYETVWEGTILGDLNEMDSTYFVHSYTVILDNPSHRLADCSYGGCLLSAVIRSGAVYGCQFHPEKSGDVGLRILKSFIYLGLKEN
jgi:imidazole glycerol-phosphate synthase subunit HisH